MKRLTKILDSKDIEKSLDPNKYLIVRMPPDLHRDMKAYCALHNISVSELVRLLVMNQIRD